MFELLIGMIFVQYDITIHTGNSISIIVIILFHARYHVICTQIHHLHLIVLNEVSFSLSMAHSLFNSRHKIS